MIVPSVGSSISPSGLPSSGEAPQQRVRVLLVVREQLSADDVQLLEHRVGLRNDLAPVFARRRCYRSLEDAKVRAIFVGQDVEIAVVRLCEVEEVFARW